jgi:hypothetical protein
MLTVHTLKYILLVSSFSLTIAAVTATVAAAQNPLAKPFNIDEINAVTTTPSASIVGEWECLVDGRSAQMSWRDQPAALVGEFSLLSFFSRTLQLDRLEDTFKPAPFLLPNRPATRITTFRSDKDDTASLRWITNDRLTGTMTWKFFATTYPVTCDRVSLLKQAIRKRVILTQ